MSEKIGQLAVEITAKPTGGREVADLAHSFELLNFAAEKVATSFAAIGTSSKGLAGKLSAIADSFEKIKAANGGIAVVDGYRKAFQKYTSANVTAQFEEALAARIAAIKDLTAEIKAASKASEEAAGKAGRAITPKAPRAPRARKPKPGSTGADLADAATEVVTSGQGADFGSALSSGDAYVASLGRIGIVAAGVVAAVGGAAIAIGTTFKATITQVQSIGGYTEEAIGKIEAQARLLGKTTQFTATQAAEAFVVLAQAGVNAEDAIASSNAALIGAATLRTDLASSTTLLIATQRQFGLSSLESARIVDVLNNSVKTSLLDFDKLRDGLKFAGPAGAQFGLSIEETVASLSALADLGLTGEQTGTVFRSALVQLTQGTEKQKQVLDDLKLTYQDISPEANKFTDVLKTLAAAGLDATQANALFGTVAGSAIGKLVSQIGEDSDFLDAKIRASLSSAGTASEQFLQVQSTLLFAFQSLVSSSQELLLSMFEQVEEPLKNVVSAVTEVVDAISLEFARVGGEMGDRLEDSTAGFVQLIKTNRTVIARSFVEMVSSLQTVLELFIRISPALLRIAEYIPAISIGLATAFATGKLLVFLGALIKLRQAFVTTQAAVVGFSLATDVATGGLTALVKLIPVAVGVLATLTAAYFSTATAADELTAAEERRQKASASQEVKDDATIAAALEAAAERTRKRLAEERAKDPNAANENDRPSELAVQVLQTELENTLDLIANKSQAASLLAASTASIVDGIFVNRDLQLGLIRQNLDRADEVVKALVPGTESLGALADGVGKDLASTEEVQAIAIAKLEESKRLLAELEQARLAAASTPSAPTGIRAREMGVDVEMMRREYSATQKALGAVEQQVKDFAGSEADLRVSIQAQSEAVVELGQAATGASVIYRRYLELVESSTQPFGKAKEDVKGYGAAMRRAANDAEVSLKQLEAALERIRKATAKSGEDESVKIVAAGEEDLKALYTVAAETLAALREAHKDSAEAVAEVNAKVLEGERLTVERIAKGLRDLEEKRLAATLAANKAIRDDLDSLSTANPLSGIFRQEAQDLATLEQNAIEAGEALDLLTMVRERQAEQIKDQKEREQALLAVTEAAELEKLVAAEQRAQALVAIEERTQARIAEVYRDSYRTQQQAAERLNAALQGFDRNVGAGADVRRQNRITFEQIAADRIKVEDEYRKRELALEEEFQRQLTALRRDGASEAAIIKAEAIYAAKKAYDEAAKKAQAAELDAKEARAAQLGNKAENQATREAFATAAQEGFAEGAAAFGKGGLDKLGKALTAKLGEALQEAFKLAGLDEEESEKKAKAVLQGIANVAGAYAGFIQALSGAVQQVADELRSAFDDVLAVSLDIREQAKAAADEYIRARKEAQVGRDPLRFGQRQVGRQVEGAQAIAEVFPAVVAGVVQGFAAGTPKLIDAFISIIPALAAGIVGAIEQILTKIVEAAPRIAQALAEALPLIIDALVVLIPKVIDALVPAIQILLKALLKALPSLIDALAQGVAEIVKALPQIIATLARNLAPVIEALVEAVPTILMAFVDSLPELIPALIDAALAVLLGVVNSLDVVLPALLALVPKLVVGFVQGLVESMPRIVKALLLDLVPGLLKALGQLLADALRGLIEPLLRVFAPKKANELYGKKEKGADKGIFGVLKSQLDSGLEISGLSKKDAERANSIIEQVLGDVLARVPGVQGFAVGSSNVQGDGLRMLHDGERVMTRAQNAIYGALTKFSTLNMPQTAAFAPSGSPLGGAQVNIYLNDRIVEEYQSQQFTRGAGRATSRAQKRTGARPGYTPPR